MEKAAREESEGSNLGFILSFIGGAASFAAGVALIVKTILYVQSFESTDQTFDKFTLIIYLAIALYFLIIGVWSVSSAYMMKREASLRKGAITSIVLGILSVNILTIIGGISGLRKFGQADKDLYARALTS